MPGDAGRVWAAGYFDATALLYLRGRVSHFDPIITITRSDKRSLYALQQVIGGSIQHTSGGSLMLYLAVNEQERALRMLLPFLIGKWAQAKLLLEFHELRTNGKRLSPEQIVRARDIARRLGKLKGRGIGV